MKQYKQHSTNSTQHSKYKYTYIYIMIGITCNTIDMQISKITAMSQSGWYWEALRCSCLQNIS